MKIKSSELKGKRIAIGQVTFTSISTYHMLKKDGVDVAMFFDRDYRLQHQRYMGTPIFPWANFYDAYVILTIPHRFEELKEMLMHSCGYAEERILRVEDILFECSELDISDQYDWGWLAQNTAYAAESYIGSRERLFQRKESMEGELIAPLLSVDVNNHCTLNCEYCYAQMPYYRTEEKRNYEMDDIIERLDTFLATVDYIPYLWVIGGEPLLHPRLHELITYLNGKRAQEKVVHADILTNGTLLFSEEVIRSLQQNPFFWRISVSPYSVHSTKQYELFLQLNEAGIPYYSRFMVYWQKFGQVIESDSVEEEMIREKCERCICRNLHLVCGKLYQCPVLAHFELLHKIPHDNRNEFDCSRSYTRKDLRNFLRRYSPGMAYCNGNHQLHLKKAEEMNAWGGEMVPVASQAKGTLPYKRYE